MPAQPERRLTARNGFPSRKPTDIRGSRSSLAIAGATIVILVRRCVRVQRCIPRPVPRASAVAAGRTTRLSVGGQNPCDGYAGEQGHRYCEAPQRSAFLRSEADTKTVKLAPFLLPPKRLRH